MLRSGQAYLNGLRDSRTVYLGSERVADVTEHRAFRNVARSVAAIYDLKRDDRLRDVLSFEDNGTRHSAYYLKARTEGDLKTRSAAHARIAEVSYGLLGRSPDYVSSFITGMAIRADLFGERADVLRAYYEHIRDNDLYLAHAIVSPHGSRDAAYFGKEEAARPACRVIRETQDGVVVSGMKMLATNAVIADEIWVGNILPLAPEAVAESITFAVRCDAPGLSLWSRKSEEAEARSAFDAPLSWRFDEPDCVLVFDEVFVPWWRVFVHGDVNLSRSIYIETPCHVYGNHQSGVRYLAKLRLFVGLASRLAQSTNLEGIPQIRETLGRLASFEALLDAVMGGQILAAEPWGEGYVGFNRRMVYAQMNWCMENYAGIVECVRDLCGSGPLQMPADSSVVSDPALGGIFATYWRTSRHKAVDRMRLFKLAWDLVGSDFAGRHLQYERFYGGPPFIVRNHSFREADWAALHDMADSLLDTQPSPV